MPSWIAWATSRPASCSASVRRHVDARRDARGGHDLAVEARPARASAPRRARRSCSSASQCEVARRPSSSPAAARTSEPVHTDVVQVLVSWTSRSHSSIGPPARAATSPGPPGTTTMSGSLTSSSVALGDQREHAVVGAHRVRARRATKLSSTPGQAAEHLVGSDRVERGEPVVEHDRDVHLGLLRVGCRAGAQAAASAVRAAEAAPVLGGADRERAQEGAAHRLGRAEAARRGDGRRSARAVSSSRRRAASRRTRST